MTLGVRPVSDLHFEFHADYGKTLAHEVTQGDFDVLVVAGDIASANILEYALDTLCGSTDKPIVYVHGNHEFYGSDRETVLRITGAAASRHAHLHWMEHGVFETRGVRFVGTPLWFRRSNAPKSHMNDFTSIRGFDRWVYEENANARAFLAETVRPGDVVVTHHLPSQRSVAPRWAKSPLNAFFVCECDGLIERTKPRLWIHGHTHDSCVYRLNDTDVVCNPFGYARHEENPRFRSCLTIDVSSAG